ncbi:hypothetical protein EST38_g12475 [Candolleomyces aberdarensis]|uniref:Uncharacterized protein n=1 Tax=Candolleomyces aberdarensis TaxID=2316362 RepID=A0A4Q2D4B5_9AGAR|nr:hypothetical protein EST38_g12475 [Candolleomyces aberdarensis]
MVKFAVPIFVAALLATSAVASSFVDVNDFESRDAAEYEELFGRCKIIGNKAIGACKKGSSVRREIDDEELEARDFEEFDEFTARDLELLGHVKELLSRYYDDLDMRAPRKGGKASAARRA